MEKLAKFGKKLKQMMRFFTKSCEQKDAVSTSLSLSSSSPPRAVHCEELFVSRRGKSRNDGGDDHDPFLAALVAAQNHFSLRPNIYI
ncbi:unnamed protein product [Linum tenue]|uniref:Uncharacterized protein n=1 Tax=Linum tenue TaxID=586396 RepID=A0AAV0R3E9_9ROSI|nr:unnamed protein product [Linum tenue]